MAIRELARLIAARVGYQGAFEWDRSKPEGQPRRLLDTRRATDAFGWRASTPLEEGLDHTVAWYLAHRAEAEATASL